MTRPSQSVRSGGSRRGSGSEKTRRRVSQHGNVSGGGRETTHRGESASQPNPGPRDEPYAETPAPELQHVSALAEPVLAALRPRGGVEFRALDCTVGGGGHSFELLDRSGPDGQLVGLDADPAALAVAEKRLGPFGNRVTLVNRNFGELAQLDLEAV